MTRHEIADRDCSRADGKTRLKMAAEEGDTNTMEDDVSTPAN